MNLFMQDIPKVTSQIMTCQALVRINYLIQKFGIVFFSRKTNDFWSWIKFIVCLKILNYVILIFRFLIRVNYVTKPRWQHDTVVDKATGTMATFPVYRIILIQLKKLLQVFSNQWTYVVEAEQKKVGGNMGIWTQDLQILKRMLCQLR